MIPVNGQGWLTTLADLAIILFMVTASDLSNSETTRDAETGMAMAVATSEPVAIFRPEAGGLPFATWLAEQPADSRQRVTIVVRSAETGAQTAIAEGQELFHVAEEAGRSPRMIIENGNRSKLVAMLTYDTTPDELARNVLGDRP